MFPKFLMLCYIINMSQVHIFNTAQFFNFFYQ